MHPAIYLRLLCLLLLYASAEPSHAAVVNLVQRGSISWTATTNLGGTPTLYEKVVTLADSVVAARAYVIGNTRSNSDSPTDRVSMELNGAGTQVIFRSYSTNTNLDIEWEVVEFTDVTVQRGVASLGSTTGTINVPITAVTLNKSVILISERISLSNSNQDDLWTIRARYTSTTNIELQRLSTGTAMEVAWQAIQFNDTTTTVQSGLTTIPNSSTTVNQGITAVTTSRSFILFSRQSGATSGSGRGREGNYMCGVEFTSSSNIRFTRQGNTDPVNTSWFVVQLGTDSAVDSGTVSMSNGGALQVNIALAGVDMSKTMTIVNVYGGGSDVNKLKDSSITSQLTSPTNIRFDRKSNGVLVQGTWMVVQFKFIAANRVTIDQNGNGRLDALRVVAFEPLNDNFSGLTISVTGYTVSGYSTGATANDNEFFVLLNELSLPLYQGDTGATPDAQFITNTSLRGTTSNILLRIEGAGVPTPDAAKPVLMIAEWFNMGSTDGVDDLDEVALTFSEQVNASGVVLSPNPLASDLELPVLSDSWATSTLANQGPSTSIIIVLDGAPRLSPGGIYNSGLIAAGSPSGVYVRVGTGITDTSPALNSALAQTSATAVDILPGGTGVVAVAWSDDHTITPRTWSLGQQEVGDVFRASTTVPPLVLGAVNAGTVRSQFDAFCSAASPSGWTAATAAGLNQFTMKVDASAPLDTVYELDLATGPKTIVNMLYSGYSHDFDLQFGTPAEISAGAEVEQTITITIVVSQN